MISRIKISKGKKKNIENENCKKQKNGFLESNFKKNTNLRNGLHGT